MKRKYISLLFAGILVGTCVVTPVRAETQNSGGWEVTLSSDGTKLTDNFNNDNNNIQSSLKNMQPGDTANIEITVKNNSSNNADFYLQNTVLDSFEDSVTASGGGYSYILTYQDTGAITRDLYRSTNVGGDDISNGKGLNEVTAKGTGLGSDVDDGYIFLENISKGKSGVVRLQITLDGESQPNAYQDSIANLNMMFAVEVIPVPTPKPDKVVEVVRHNDNRIIYLPNTGDDSNIGIYIGGFIASLLLFVYAYYKLKQTSKKA